ncbi:hypothetical protein [Dactylosporangium sp. NPDC005555]|uniref:hypothetical protein n=1 Tax=Dactylosporangium sp. NPDC005555 TaxID=3154889 RepID=UPI0033B44520
MRDMRRRISMSVVALTASIATSAVALPAPAQAAIPTCPGRCHAYGIAYPYNLLNAVSANISVNCLHVPNRISQFVNWEMWLMTRSDRGSDPLTWNWVEVGMTAGTLRYDNPTQTGFMWFWADSYATYGSDPGGYFEHYISSATVQTTSNVSLYWVPNQNGVYGWNVYKNGTQWGWSGVGSFPHSPRLGAESTNGNIAVDGWADDWRYREATSGIWKKMNAAPVKSGNAINVSLPTDGQVHGWTPQWACGGPGPSAASGARLDGADSAEPDHAPLMRTQAGVRQRLLAKTNQAVSMLGTADVGRSRYVKTTRNAALGRHHDTAVAEDRPVYLVQLNGTFSRPDKHGRTLNGSVLELVVDAETGQLTDWGITSGGKSLDSLGVTAALA